MDYNKQRRDYERRILRRAGWEAGNGLKKNGAFRWIWIHPKRSRAYSREQAYVMALRDLKS